MDDVADAFTQTLYFERESTCSLPNYAGSKAYANRFNWGYGKTIHFCPIFFSPAVVPFSEHPTLILHEMTHVYGGTVDHARILSPPRTSGGQTLAPNHSSFDKEVDYYNPLVDQNAGERTQGYISAATATGNGDTYERFYNEIPVNGF